MKNLLLTLTGIGLLIIIWQILAVVLARDLIIPMPGETFRVLFNTLEPAEFLRPAFDTTWKVFVAFTLAILSGFLIGFVLGLSDILYTLNRPLILVIQAVPVVSWLSLVIFGWGIGWKGPVFIAFLSLLPISVLTTASGVRSIDQKLLEMARIYRVPRARVFADVYFGSLVPFMVSIIDVSIGLVWKVMLVAEYLCGKDGLGVHILIARMNVDVPRVWALTFIAVSLGMITEHSIKNCLRRITYSWIPA